MATEVVITVGSGGSPTYDYGDLATALSTEAKDISASTGSDEQYTFRCYDFTDNGSATMSGWTTEAGGNYVKVYAAAGERHDGTTNGQSAGGYLLVGSSGSVPLTISGCQHVVLEGLRLQRYVGGANPAAVLLVTDTSAWEIDVSECIFDADENFTRCVDITGGASGATFTIWNSLLYGSEKSGIRCNAANVDVVCLYCTGIDCARQPAMGIFNNVSANSFTCTGCIGNNPNVSYGTVSTAFRGTITQSYNLSDDSSASGTGSVTSTSLTFVDSSSNGDYHLHSTSDTAAIDAGESSPSHGFTDDVDGDTRGSTWDIGFDEVAGGGGGGGATAGSLALSGVGI